MKIAVRSVRSVGDHRLEVAYVDGLVAVLDLTRLLGEHSGPVVDPLRDQKAFDAVRLDEGVLTWPTGFDICPDVLRYWCEEGQVCPGPETDNHFESRRSLPAS